MVVSTLLLLGASSSQVPAIRHAQAIGHRVVAVDGDPNAVGFEIADVAVNVDFAHVAEVIAAAAVHGVDGVLAISSDRAVVPAAAVAEALALPGIGIDVARAMTDKPTMRARLGHAGLPQPRAVVLTPDSELDAAFYAISAPAVLKPADSGGQRGLHLIRSLDDLERYVDEAFSFSATSRAILEEFVDGPELNALLVVRNGEPDLITLSDRLRPAGPGFGVGWIHLYPSALEPEVLERAHDVACDAVRTLGLVDGIAFVQLIVGAGEVHVVEAAARIAAGQMADLVRFATGVELYDVAIETALGRPVPDDLVFPTRERPVAIRFLTADPGVLPAGKVVSVDGFEDVLSSRGVVGAALSFGPGDTIMPVRVDADRRGYVAATAESPSVALALAENAARKLLVRTARDVEPAQPARLLLSAGAGIAALAASVALVATHSGLRPRLVSDAIRDQAGKLAVRYSFNEPVRAEILVDGQPATALSSLGRSGKLLWRARKLPAGPVAIEGIDPSGHRAVYNVTIRVPAGARARHRGAA